MCKGCSKVLIAEKLTDGRIMVGFQAKDEKGVICCSTSIGAYQTLTHAKANLKGKGK